MNTINIKFDNGDADQDWADFSDEETADIIDMVKNTHWECAIVMTVRNETSQEVARYQS